MTPQILPDDLTNYKAKRFLIAPSGAKGILRLREWTVTDVITFPEILLLLSFKEYYRNRWVSTDHRLRLYS